MRPHPLLVVSAVCSLAGFGFAAFSTYDFAQHLDRQVHGIHCSFLPGVTDTDVTGTSGCHLTLMSPYSSIWREALWGGLPISLPAMSVFAFLVFWCSNLVLARRQLDPRGTGFLVLAAGLPVAVSVVMGIISFFELDAACKVCIGIYVSSFGAFGAALALWLRARRLGQGRATAATGEGATLDAAPQMPTKALAFAFAIGIVFVVIPVVAYASLAPDFGRYVGACGSLTSVASATDVLVAIGPQTRQRSVVEVLDPLCPACRAFERRFDGLPAAAHVKRQALLFPLDNQCNWMVDRPIHPGACLVSEAILCAGDQAESVLDWAFDEQERIREVAATDLTRARRLITTRFPSLERCIGRPAVRARLNRALRWAVNNELPVLTPQVYVDGTRLCDADTDLGVEYTLSRLIERGSAR